jgi:hypothetical protein
MSNEESKNRCVRMTDSEWSAFKKLLGMPWLRGQIAKAKKREQRKPVAQEIPE